METAAILLYERHTMMPVRRVVGVMVVMFSVTGTINIAALQFDVSIGANTQNQVWPHARQRRGCQQNNGYDDD